MIHVMNNNIRTMCFCATLALSGVGLAAVSARQVLSEEAILSLRPDRYSFDGHGNLFCKQQNGVLKVTLPDGRGVLRMRPYRFQPPFHGPDEVVVDASNVVGKCDVTLTLKDFRTKQLKSVTVPFAPKMRFSTGCSFGDTYMFDSLAFTSSVPKWVSCHICAVTGVFRQTAAESCRFDVDTGSPLHIVRDGDPAPSFTLTNPTADSRHWNGTVRGHDFYGRTFKLPFDVSVAPGSTARVPVALGEGGVSAKGAWLASAEIFGDDGSVVTNETRFARIDRHEPHPKSNPGAGEFRPGIHIHAARSGDYDRALEFDAAAAMGAKLTRIDFTFSPPVICREAAGKYDWSFPDLMLAECERAGLAVDALIFENLGWRYDAAFCEAIAARYGTRIDFYEIGNEWDILDAKRFPVERGVEIQKWSYQALKKGNPAVKVITNGWTVEDSNGHEAVVQKGFQEKFLEDAKGFFDVHAIHLHGPFDYYRRKLVRFFELRREKSVADVPWFPNETAMSCQYRGEEPVAEGVWQKMLHSWSLGATDYVWYCQRAPSPRYDLTFGYGMISYDWRPALSYCAFSAFTAVFGGLRFDRTLCDGEYRRVHRFQSAAEGRRRIVVAGWDAAALATNVPIRVKTDAKDVWAVDLMNNRLRLKPVDGQVEWHLSYRPSAIMCEGGTFLEPDAAVLANVLEMPVKVVRVLPNRDGRGWDLVLDNYNQVHEGYPADPANAHRAWKGKDDLSAIVLFVRKPDGYGRARVYLTDDIQTDGDKVRFFIDGKDVTDELHVTRDRQGKTHCGYWAEMPPLKQFRFNIRIIDDDGHGGPDGWMDFVPFDEKDPKVKTWPYVTFE